MLCAVFSIVISGCIISGCSKDKEATFDPNATSNPTTTENLTDITSNPTVTLTWDAPTSYTDGSPLAPGDLKEFRIYFSTQPGSYSTSSYYTVLAPATSITVTEIISQSAGTYYFVVTAVDTTNMESDISNEVSKELY